FLENIGDSRAELAVRELPCRDVHRDFGHAHFSHMPRLELATGLGQYPIPDFHHQPELFEHGDEFAGRYQTTARMAPAQQGFGASQAFAVTTELRLVVEGE